MSETKHTPHSELGKGCADCQSLRDALWRKTERVTALKRALKEAASVMLREAAALRGQSPDVVRDALIDASRAIDQVLLSVSTIQAG